MMGGNLASSLPVLFMRVIIELMDRAFFAYVTHQKILPHQLFPQLNNHQLKLVV